MTKILEPKDVSHDELRFVARVELLANGCWLWHGQTQKADKWRPIKVPLLWTGGGKYKGGKTKIAYRYAYEKRIDKLPNSRYWALIRQCEVELCVNPYHYDLVERKTLALAVRPNLIASIKANPMCKNGLHERTPENVVRNGTGRTCRPCQVANRKIVSKRYNEKKKLLKKSGA